jgi:hypothetical protein
MDTTIKNEPAQRWRRGVALVPVPLKRLLAGNLSTDPARGLSLSR